MTIKVTTVAIGIAIAIIVTIIVDFATNYSEANQIGINLKNVDAYFNDNIDENHVVIKNGDVSVVINRDDEMATKIEKIRKIL